MDQNKKKRIVLSSEARHTMRWSPFWWCFTFPPISATTTNLNLQRADRRGAEISVTHTSLHIRGRCEPPARRRRCSPPHEHFFDSLVSAWRSFEITACDSRVCSSSTRFEGVCVCVCVQVDDSTHYTETQRSDSLKPSWELLGDVPWQNDCHRGDAQEVFFKDRGIQKDSRHKSIVRRRAAARRGKKPQYLTLLSVHSSGRKIRINTFSTFRM